MEKGVCKWFDRKRGYGFIQMENGNDIFVHFSAIKGNGKILFEGDKVQFEIGEGRNGKPQATNVEVFE